ncbi:MAG: peptidase M23 [Alteromonadaceae bacterium]|nr:MAG: peptidase M23 [Alteromonadaceae bacterium]
MEATDSTQENPKTGVYHYFPTTHLVGAALLSLGLVAFLLTPEQDANLERQITTITIPMQTATTTREQQAEIKAEFEQSAPIRMDPLREPRANDTRNITQVVRSGDNLSKIFKRAGLNDKQMMQLIHGHPKAKRLTSLYPGHKITFEISNDQKLVSLHYQLNKLDSFSFKNTASKYEYAEVSRTADIKLAHGAATIKQSLYNAGVDARLSDGLIMSFAEIFGWDVDFALDIRTGDHFKIVYEEKFLDGEKIGYGAILAAEFTNQGDTFRAVRYTDKSGQSSYYTPDGKSMRKAFLRAPLDFRRISDNFNPRRLHPVHKTVRAHRGTDYAADRGTPVWASGDGKVIRSGYSRANGNYVFIQHGNNIKTKYLHLHKRMVKTGQRVRQKQKIGTVGSTGYATGPHLHYEFLTNGVHRNPRTILNKLPKAQSIDAKALPRFLAQTQTLAAQLNVKHFSGAYALAPREENSSDTTQL